MTMSFPLTQVMAIAAGGAVGSVMRFGVSNWVHGFAGRAFPYGTLVVNVLGSLVIGLLFVLLTERGGDNSVLRAGLMVGVLGGFTTFSSFSIETFNLIEQGEAVTAIANVLMSVLLCLFATWLGVLLARSL